MIRKILFYLVILFSINIYSQNKHILILEKDNRNQVYTISKSFPKNWIKNNWNKNYLIEHINYTNSSWFVVMQQYNNSIKQEYLINPGFDRVNERLNDGYKIKDICIYEVIDKDRGSDKIDINNIYILNKVATDKVFLNYTVASPNNSGINIVNFIKKGWIRNWICSDIKTFKFKGNIWYSILMDIPKNGFDQIIETRKDFPKDFINNKRTNGYYLTSLNYDYRFKNWIILMTKTLPVQQPNDGKTVWRFDNENQKKERRWFIYESNKKVELMNLMNNKGYNIINVM